MEEIPMKRIKFRFLFLIKSSGKYLMVLCQQTSVCKQKKKLTC